MNLSENNSPNYNRLQEITRELFTSIGREELNEQLTLLLSVYIQYAEVSRLSLSNTATLITKLITYLNLVQEAAERKELKLTIEKFLSA